MTPKRFLLILIGIVVLLAVAGGAYFALSRDTFDATATGTPEGDLTEADVEKIINAVGEHMMLPEGEEPVAATIVDIDELIKTQPFYRGAINGDILLVYQAAAKAIIYSPSRDMLVNVGPIIVEDEAAPADFPADEAVSDETSSDEEAL